MYSIIVTAHGNETKQESAHEHGTDEMDMGDMEKLEQDTGNIGEVYSFISVMNMSNNFVLNLALSISSRCAHHLFLKVGNRPFYLYTV